ncbi:YggT family protein [Gleimia sp. 6138-11-ORH1]|uniref:YggT family protein n=1 Tax=Gleimia sp. 6138-11-ORH1 TaxID=2973937 RepID=UPI00216A01C4|nr:YggT family protein [Gleimia sp. 6138-11-ORH1]MCS4484533.1 YggT family protein [Gleimia sp. 6138-11-ORH1]
MTSAINFLGHGILILAQLAVFILIARMILDWLSILAPQLEIPAVIAVLANLVYKLSNPPLEYLRKFLPPLRFGEISIDMGFIVLFILVIIVRKIAIFLISM